MDKEAEHENLCNHCGLCCQFEDGTDCQHLIRLGNSTTKCSIYGKHRGTYLGNGYYCEDIMNVKLYDGCPYNDLKIAKLLSTAKAGQP